MNINHINLYIIKNFISTYQQFTDDFVGSLSIIDVLMFNHKQDVKEMLNEFKLI